MMPPAVIHRHSAPFIVLILLAGVWADRRLFHLPTGDAAAYHARLRTIAQQLPTRIGDWDSSEVETPASAVALLRPNVLVGREFKNRATGERAMLMIVQCRDARDMRGHWPPICYPAQGWLLRESRQASIVVNGAEIPVTAYRFTIESIERYSEILVYNFFMRSGGILESGQGGVREAAQDPRAKIYGAAQVQISFVPTIPEPRREEIFRTLVAGLHPIIDGVLAGEGR